MRAEKKEKALTGREAVCGESSQGFLASFDPITSSWRTPQLLLTGDLEEFLQTLPRSGSMRNGQLRVRAPWVPHTHGKGCSLWPTLLRPNGGRSVPQDANWTSGATAYTKDGRKIQVGVESAVRRVFGPGPVNPEFAEWLMGFPIGWTELADSETPSSHK